MNADIEEHATLRHVHVKSWIYSYLYTVYIHTYANIFVILEALSSLISTVSLYFPAPKPSKNSFSNKTAYYDVGLYQLDTSLRHRRRFIIWGYFRWFSLNCPYSATSTPSECNPSDSHCHHLTYCSCNTSLGAIICTDIATQPGNIIYIIFKL